MMMKSPLMRMILGVAVALIGVSGYATYLAMARPPAFHGTVYEPAPAADFHLTDVDGRAKTLASFRGAPALLFFGYTKCADFCPLTLDRLSRVIKELGDDAKGARIVFVSVDPANDTPDVLRAYAARFGPHVTALTGDSAALAEAWRGYGVYITAGASAGEAAAHGHHGAHPAVGPAALTHSGVVYGIDRNGDLRVVLTEGATQESMRDDVRTLARL